MSWEIKLMKKITVLALLMSVTLIANSKNNKKSIQLDDYQKVLQYNTTLSDDVDLSNNKKHDVQISYFNGIVAVFVNRAATICA